MAAMDLDEAGSLLARLLSTYRAKPYQELAGLVDSLRVEEVRAASGTVYQVEIQFVWDSKAGGDVRVMGSIDDGGLRAFRPLSDDFIVAPDGTFVGE